MLVGGVFWWRPWHQRSAAPASRAASSSQTDAASVAGAQPPRAAESPGEEANSPELVAGGAGARADDAAAAPGVPGAAVSSTAAAPEAPAPATADAARGAGRARLRLSFSADSWVDVHDAEGGRVYAGSGRANSVKTIAGIAPLRVYLGFASGVQLQLNDRAVAIGPQFVTGDVARFEAGADGVLRRDTRAAPANGVPANGVPANGVPANGVPAHAAPPRG